MYFYGFEIVNKLFIYSNFAIPFESLPKYKHIELWNWSFMLQIQMQISSKCITKQDYVIHLCKYLKEYGIAVKELNIF